MATKSEENRRKQQALINAGYRGVVADGSWGPYQQKLYLHYLANKLGPTKQQKINSAKQANQREAQISKQYFSQAPSIGNLAKGVYHWWNSIPALGGQNESGVQEYNVASNPVVAAASPGNLTRTGQIVEVAGRGYNRIKGFLGRSPISGKGKGMSTFGRKLQENADDAIIVEGKSGIVKDINQASQYEPNFILVRGSKSKNLPTVYNKSKVDKAKEMAKESEIPVAEATNDWQSVRVEPTSAPKPSAEPPKQTPPIGNGEPPTTGVQNEPKKKVDWNYILGFGSFKPNGGFGQKSSTVGKWILNAGKLGGAYHLPAYVYDSHVQNERRAEAQAQGKEYIETPTLAWNISPFGIIQNITKSDIEKGQNYYRNPKKQSVEDDWLKQLDEAGKNVGY